MYTLSVLGITLPYVFKFMYYSSVKELLRGCIRVGMVVYQMIIFWYKYDNANAFIFFELLFILIATAYLVVSWRDRDYISEV